MEHESIIDFKAIVFRVGVLFSISLAIVSAIGIATFAIASAIEIAENINTPIVISAEPEVIETESTFDVLNIERESMNFIVYLNDNQSLLTSIVPVELISNTFDEVDEASNQHITVIENYFIEFVDAKRPALIISETKSTTLIKKQYSFAPASLRQEETSTTLNRSYRLQVPLDYKLP